MHDVMFGEKQRNEKREESRGNTDRKCKGTMYIDVVEMKSHSPTQQWQP